MRKITNTITGQQDSEGKTDAEMKDGAELVQLLMRKRSTERMEDDPGVEYRNRRDTGCDSGGKEELSDQDPSIYCRWKCQSLAGWGGS